MPEWEYKVESVGHIDHPYWEVRYPALEIQALLEERGKEGWELVHIHETKGRWRSAPETYPGGDPGRCVWDSGESVLHFKRQARKNEELHQEVPGVSLGPSESAR